MSDRLYDALNKIQRWLPALAVAWMSISTIWDIPYGEPIRDTILAIATLMAATLEVANSQYNRING